MFAGQESIKERCNRFMIVKRFMAAALLAGNIFAQNGDKPGEVQAPPPPTIKIPPAPALSPEDALKSFKLAPGFKIEVAASEPLIEAPVEFEFDPDGRMYVVEMRGFMPNVEGTGEDKPVGRVSVLEDSDGDGRMDKSTIFADGLVMPRALALVPGGVLVAEPPRLWFFKDSDGDGKADQKEEVANNYGDQKNPEHTANGLLWALDNWIYSANHTVRYRITSGEWEQEPTNSRGQWGISQDDFGRLFFNSNSDQLRGDLVPTQYLTRNPNFRKAFGGNVQLAKSQAVWPGRVNPGVNRGYQKGQLRDDGTLATFTGACGPVVYRGHLFPGLYRGAAFLCEPTANIVRCNLLKEKDGIITAENALDRTEFLTSTDERFRPVNINNGPEGALYVVDLYRGVLQHRIYLTTYLRNQALDRGLDKPLNLGRIYRIVPENAPRSKPKALSKLSPPELVQELQSPNGWTRETAQRLLIGQGNPASFDSLKRLATTSQNHLAQLHALWTLDGLGELDPATLKAGLSARHPKVRVAAIRLAERFLRAEGRNEIENKVVDLSVSPDFDVQLQLAYSLGESNKPEPQTVLRKLAQVRLENKLLRDAFISGLAGRELATLRAVLSEPELKTASGGGVELLRDLALCVIQSGKPDDINAVLELAANAPAAWQPGALLDGLLAIVPPAPRNKPKAEFKPVLLPAEPTALETLRQKAPAGIENKLAALNDLLVWNGKPGYVAAEVIPLTAKEQELFEAGKTLYITTCGACHQPNGQGLEGLAPPLVDSGWTTGSEERLIRIVLQGVRGPMNIKGKTWELEMPPLNIMDDQQIASVLTYVRREWGHNGSPISEEQVKKIRAATDSRIEAWTEEELLKIK